MKRWLLLILAGFFMSCNQPSSEQDEKVADIDTLENSEEFNGVFNGTIPCADCPGIETVLEFSPDHTFREHLTYLERNADFSAAGQWKMQDSLIAVTYADSGAQQRYYKVLNDSTIVMLDGDRKEITGPIADHYLLRRKSLP